MELLIKLVEIFAFITGLIYIVLEIGQKNSMWIVGILTGLACSFSFAVQHVWASMGLNLYYVCVSVWGLYQWKKDGEKLGDEQESAIHLNKLSGRSALVSLLIFALGSVALVALLRLLNGTETVYDALVAIMSAIATWWLAKSYIEQWLIWIFADALAAILCLLSGMYWMAVMYLAYAASAIYGYIHWKKHGVFID